MRRTSAALVALVAAIALTALAAPAWAAKAKPKTRALVVSPTDVRAGQMVTVSGGSCRSAGVLALSIDNQEFHRGYTRRGNFRYDVKLPRGLESGSHSMGASCRGSKHKAARFNIKDKKRDWDDDGCEEGYEDEEGEEGYEGYGNNVRDDEGGGYEEDCDEDEGKHRRKASFDVSPDVVTAGDKVWAEGTGCKKYSLVIIKLDGWPIKWTYADRWGTFDKGIRLPRHIRKGRHLFSAKCGGRHIGSDGIKVKNKYSQHHDGMHSYGSVVKPGKKLRFRGDDCPDGRPVATLDRKPLALKVVSRKKGFEAEATIPHGTLPGKHKFHAGCDAGSSGTTELNVLDPDSTKPAAARQPFGTQPTSDPAVWAGLFTGLALLVASIYLTTRRRGNRG
jgi:hypothetical protein